jgi:small-conductance mechanosensitive channel
MEKMIAWFDSILPEISRTEFWWQILCLLLAIAFASFTNSALRKMIAAQSHQDVGFRHIAVSTIQRLLWPLSALLALVLLKAIFSHYGQPSQLLEVFIPVLFALACIRLCVYFLRKAFTTSPLLKSSESLLAGVIWVGVLLHLFGWLPTVIGLMDSLAFSLGETRISVLSIFKLFAIIALAFTLAIWISELITKRVSRSEHISPSMKVGFAKFSKFLLITLAFLVALNMVGIDLSSLAVFGGALGVGLGFGLQRIASNFISGFILVLDRSIKPGDIITVGQNFGWVEQLNARYLVVRNREGVETLIPNENLITSEVINWSYTDKNVRVVIKIQISYDDDPEQAMALMMACANASPRVLNDPPPNVRLMNFADNGIELHLRVWIADMENGTGTVKSDVNLAIWRAFKQHGITIPYPQRDLHIKSGLTLPAFPEDLSSQQEGDR